MANGVTKSSIARELGVSVTSVATVLNEKPIRISSQLKRRIVLKAKEMGYNFNSSKNHRAERREIAYLIVNPNANPDRRLSGDYLYMLNGIHSVMDKCGYKVSYLGSLDVEKALNSVSHYHDDSGVVLILTGYVDERLIDPLQELSVPFIVMGSYDSEKEDFHRVAIDFEDAARKATSALIQAGAKRVLSVVGQWTKRINRDMLNGYKKALEEAKAPFYPELIQSYEDNPSVMWRKLKDIGVEYDGVISGPTTAFELNMAARTRGIKVPEDLKIVSMTDDELLTKVRPNISCMRLDIKAYGEAVNELIKAMHEDTPEPAVIKLEKEYVERESSKAI